jgi:hypothetical protein
MDGRSKPLEMGNKTVDTLSAKRNLERRKTGNVVLIQE